MSGIGILSYLIPSITDIIPSITDIIKAGFEGLRKEGTIFLSIFRPKIETEKGELYHIYKLCWEKRGAPPVKSG